MVQWTSGADDTQLLDSAYPDGTSLLRSCQEESIKTVQSYFTFTNNYLKNEPQQNEPASSRHFSNGKKRHQIGTIKNAPDVLLQISYHNIYPQPAIQIIRVALDSNLTWDTLISSKCDYEVQFNFILPY